MAGIQKRLTPEQRGEVYTLAAVGLGPLDIGALTNIPSAIIAGILDTRTTKHMGGWIDEVERDRWLHQRGLIP